MTETTTNSVPKHLGLILDGNRRWAKKQGLPTLEGHRKGYSKLKEIAKYAINSGVTYVSAFIFSTENWNRSQEEVKYLMDLAYLMVTKEVNEIHKENIKVRFLGNREGIAPKLLKAIENAEEKTKNNTKGTLALCFNYGGQQEIVDATKQLVEQGIKASDVTTGLIEQHLYAPEVPPVDLLIRTSGEQRLSGFMLWRAAYAELAFTDTFWPDFTTEDLTKIIQNYNNRERRFGS